MEFQASRRPKKLVEGIIEILTYLLIYLTSNRRPL